MSGAIIALDQEKAYDKILHPYLWSVLRKFGFPEQFIKTIQALYENAKTFVMINGELSEPFTVCRGVRQGDALSCLLFDIAIEPLAENIRKSTNIGGIPIPGKKGSLKIKLFADDTTVFLSEDDNMDELQDILEKWCKVSGAKFNIEKTEIIPLGNVTQRNQIVTSRKLNMRNDEIPSHIHIARDGEPVRILGAWLGNKVDQATTWAPILENCCKRLKRWGSAKHSLEGRRLILQMQVAGVTQYLTKVQGMPPEIESEMSKLTRRFMWNNEKSDTVNQAQMHAPHKKGGKKMLDIEARNKAIHLTWLQAYLNLGNDRATWTYFADAIIAIDIPPSYKIDNDPEARIMPIIQNWSARERNSSLPEDLKAMLKLAKEFKVQVSATTPKKNVQLELPIWYHVRSVPSARKLYKTKKAKCLRKKHNIKLVGDALDLLNNTPENHSPDNSCKCNICLSLRSEYKCTHPHNCIELTANLIKKIHPKWNPTVERRTTILRQESENTEDDEGVVFDPANETETLKDAITIFGETLTEPAGITKPAPCDHEINARETIVFTDGACINNGKENARAGSGVWYGDNDPRNLSVRVALQEQSNQTGELIAALLAIRNQPPNENLRIMSDSKYLVDGLTKHVKNWEDKGWMNVKHKEIFKCMTALLRWRNGKTTLQWVKGHDGIKGNEEADKLAGEGARKPIPETPVDLTYPTNQIAIGAKIAVLEQRDFYQMIKEKRQIPVRRRTDLIVGRIQACTEDTFGASPTIEHVWSATRHKDFTRKTRDFLWKCTQNAYKIGEYWNPIPGFEQRGVCPICDEIEDMDHILTKCTSRPRKILWELANELWSKRSNTPLSTQLGDIIGCGLAEFTHNNKPDQGKNRLYRIIMSETAYLTWKIRNERRIRDGDEPQTPTTDSEITNRWTNAINKRLTIDRALTNNIRFGKNAIKPEVVTNTWIGCLKNEDDLPTDWYKLKGVLVGIASTRPRGRNR